MNYSNNAFSVIVGAIASADTIIALAPGTGSRFPASDFRATLVGYDVNGNEDTWEIVHCSSRSGDALTVTRGQEGTSAVAWDNGARIENRITAGSMAALEPTITPGTTAQYLRGDKGWRDFFTDVRAATLTGLSTATNAVVAATDTVLAAIGKLQKQVSDNLATLTSHTGNTSNPHGVTKVQVGLGDVDNTSDVNKPVSTEQANAIAARYGKNNVLGTVSQSAGVPTGAVIERGSNGNGEYVRFADGTQICTILSTFTAAAEVVWTFPAVFAATPNYLSASVNYPLAPRHYNVDTAVTGGGTYATIYRSVRETRAPVADGFEINVMAVGRWF